MCWVYKRKDGSVIISIRGTEAESELNWATNSTFYKQENGIHHGFLEKAQKIWDKIFEKDETNI